MFNNELSIDELKKLQWKIMQDVSASALIPLMRIGDELGLFNVLGRKGPCTESDFSNYAKIDQRYAREWLLAMCAAGYVSHTDRVSKFRQTHHATHTKDSCRVTTTAWRHAFLRFYLVVQPRSER